MKIIHVANFGHKNNIAYYYHTARKLSLGFSRLGHAVFDFSDRDVARASNILGHRKFGVGAANRKLIETCRNIRPDLVVFGHADVIQPDTVVEIRSAIPNLRIAQWNYDPLFSEDNCKKIESKLAVVDATFITTSGDGLARFSRAGTVVSFIPNPTDPSLETGRSFARSSHNYDLIFSGRNGKLPRMWDGSSVESNEIARRLQAALLGRRLIFPGLLEQPTIYGIDYVNALDTSKIGLSLSQRNDAPLYASDRMAHCLANGVLTCIDRATGFGRIFRDDEVLFYSCSEDLIEKIRYYLGNEVERCHVAERGWAKAHALFNGKRVAKYLIEQTFQLPLSEDYEWPSEVY
jgi:hypothetical protein